MIWIFSRTGELVGRARNPKYDFLELSRFAEQLLLISLISDRSIWPIQFEWFRIVDVMSVKIWEPLWNETFPKSRPIIDGRRIVIAEKRFQENFLDR